MFSYIIVKQPNQFPNVPGPYYIIAGSVRLIKDTDMYKTDAIFTDIELDK